MNKRMNLSLGPEVTLVQHDGQTEQQNRMNLAFSLVSPEYWGAARGLDWKDQINAVLVEEDLKTAGVTIQEVVDSVEFMTATKATLRESTVHLTNEKAYIIKADGYRRGPAC